MNGLGAVVMFIVGFALFLVGFYMGATFRWERHQ